MAVEKWPFIDDWQKRSMFSAAEAEAGIKQLRDRIDWMTDEDESLVWRFLWNANVHPKQVTSLWASSDSIDPLRKEIARFSEKPVRVEKIFSEAFSSAWTVKKPFISKKFAGLRAA